MERKEETMLGSATATVEFDGEKKNETKDNRVVNCVENYENSIVIAAHTESKNLECAAWCRLQRTMMEEVRAKEEELAVLQRKLRKTAKLKKTAARENRNTVALAGVLEPGKFAALCLILQGKY